MCSRHTVPSASTPATSATATRDFIIGTKFRFNRFTNDNHCIGFVFNYRAPNDMFVASVCRISKCINIRQFKPDGTMVELSKQNFPTAIDPRKWYRLEMQLDTRNKYIIFTISEPEASGTALGATALNSFSSTAPAELYSADSAPAMLGLWTSRVSRAQR